MSAASSTKVGGACGARDGRIFDQPADAFAVVDKQKPPTQNDMAGVTSATDRFHALLLSSLRGGASDIVMELRRPSRHPCDRAACDVWALRHEVVKRQAKANPTAYGMVGDATRRVGVVPDALRSNDKALDVIANAGDDAIVRMLETVAQRTGAQPQELLGCDERLGHGNATPRWDWRS